MMIAVIPSISPGGAMVSILVQIFPPNYRRVAPGAGRDGRIEELSIL
jgi:hypothetical protein